MDMKAVLHRIDRRLAALELTDAGASRAATGSPDTIRNWRRSTKAGSKGGATVRKIEALAPVLRTTPTWLLEGVGPEDGIEAGPDLSFVPVPLVSWVSAGALLQPDMPIPDVDELPPVYAPDLDPSGDWIALRVDGDSMNRISPHDSIIFVNRKDRRLVPNACYVIGDGEGGATYKRYRPPNTWEPVSTNEAHKPFDLPSGREPDIIGRVRKTILAM